MGLFDKKYCDICGEKIGLLGNKKLEDGNMCRACAKKLSPWFEDRRHTNLEDIKMQLDAREKNREAVAAFHVSREIGENTRVLVDERAGTFMVTDERNWQEENPDVLQLSQVTGVDLDVNDTRSELYRTDKDGNKESYNPPRYKYRYRFQIKIRLDHPYLDEISYQINSDALEIEYTDHSLFGLGSLDPTRDSEYRKYRDMGEEIKKILTGTRPHREEEPEEQPVPASQPETAFCPNCGAQVLRTNKFCEHCGSKLGQ